MNEKLIKEYKSFLDNGKTERECVEQLIAMATKAGYKDIAKCKKLAAGDKVYITKMIRQLRFFRLEASRLRTT